MKTVLLSCHFSPAKSRGETRSWSIPESLQEPCVWVKYFLLGYFWRLGSFVLCQPVSVGVGERGARVVGEAKTPKTPGNIWSMTLLGGLDGPWLSGRNAGGYLHSVLQILAETLASVAFSFWASVFLLSHGFPCSVLANIICQHLTHPIKNEREVTCWSTRQWHRWYVRWCVHRVTRSGWLINGDCYLNTLY